LYCWQNVATRNEKRYSYDFSGIIEIAGQEIPFEYKFFVTGNVSGKAEVEAR
jgi:hypothetical protein